MNKYGFRHYTQFSRFCKNYLQATPAQLIASIRKAVVPVMSPLAWTGTRLCRQRGVVGSWNREEPPSRFFLFQGAWQPVYVEVGELPSW